MLSAPLAAGCQSPCARLLPPVLGIVSAVSRFALTSARCLDRAGAVMSSNWVSPPPASPAKAVVEAASAFAAIRGSARALRPFRWRQTCHVLISAGSGHTLQSQTPVLSWGKVVNWQCPRVQGRQPQGCFQKHRAARIISEGAGMHF